MHIDILKIGEIQKGLFKNKIQKKFDVSETCCEDNKNKENLNCQRAYEPLLDLIITKEIKPV